MQVDLDSLPDDDNSMPWLRRAMVVVFFVGFLAGGGQMLMVHIQSVQSLRKENFELREANWLLEKERGKGVE